MKLISKQIESKYGKKILFNETLANYSWFNLGGPSEVFFKPNSIEDITFFLKNVNPKKITILGAGSNTLIRDGGVKGITIKLGSQFSYLNLLPSNIIEIGASTLDKKIADFALANSLTGLEFLVDAMVKIFQKYFILLKLLIFLEIKKTFQLLILNFTTEKVIWIKI